MKSSSNGASASRKPYGGSARKVLVMLTVAAAVLDAGRVAAQPASDAPRIAASAEVSILGVEVVVTDRNGKSVHG
jgi:hypothetical protein